MTRRTAVAAIVMYGAWAPLRAHPHDGDTDRLVLKGIIAFDIQIDLKALPATR